MLVLLPLPALLPSVGVAAGLRLAAVAGEGEGLLLPLVAFSLSAAVAAGLGLGLAAAAADAEGTGLLLPSPGVLPWFGVGEGWVTLALASRGGLPLSAGEGDGRALLAGGALVPAAGLGDGSGAGLGLPLPADSEGPGEAGHGDRLVPSRSGAFASGAAGLGLA